MTMIQEYVAKIVNIESLGLDTKHFVFELNNSIDFKPGQFISLGFEHEGKKHFRPFSVASRPLKDNKLELLIKVVGEGRFTPLLFEKKLGDEVFIKGPYGLFTLENSKRNKLVFVGSGTGLSPLRSMIHHLLKTGVKKEIILILGVRYENEIYFEKEFEAFERDHPNFKFIKTISKPSENWQGKRGHVHHHFDIVDLQQSEFYICGSKEMVKESIDKLKALDVSEEDIKIERY